MMNPYHNTYPRLRAERDAETGYTALPPTLQTRMGQGLQGYLGGLRSMQPTDNPYGKAAFDFFLSGAEDMAGEMARGNPYAVIDPRPRGPYINPQILDTLGILPVATAAKIPSEVIAPGLLAGAAAAMGKIAKPTDGTPSLLEAMTPGMVDPRTGLLSMTGYHGTPHRFPPTEKNPLGEFDLQKIGTGEGAQAFGHGIYVAEHPDTAKHYIADRSYVGRVMQGKPSGLKHDAESIAQTAVDEHGDAALNHLQNVLKQRSYSKNPKQIESNKTLQEAITLVEKGGIERQGSLYEVDIPDEIIDNQMLDWDKPLSEQSEAVRRSLEGFKLPRDQIEPGRQAGQTGWQLYDKETGYLVPYYSFSSEKEAMDFLENPTGSDIYNLLSGGNDTAMAAEVSSSLRSKGISGIKYKDAASRGKEGGTRNFVLFDPSVANITGRN